MIDQIENLPEVSFIDDITLKNIEANLIENYKDRYEQLTGKRPDLARADVPALILYACSVQLYQILLYADRTGKMNLLKYAYEQIFKNRDLKFFMQKRKYDYCFVSLGINDTYKKMSTTYYQQSMKYILKFLLSNQIHPIIMEIPDYDINKSFDRQSISKKSLRLLSMFINNTPLDCRQNFRQALDATLKEDGIKNNVSILRYLSWNGNGDKNMNTLYNKDGLHLNERGYAKLDSCIAKICIKLYKNSQYGKN